MLVPQYDQVVLDALENKVTAKGTLKGHLDIYRYCDNVRRRRHWGAACFCRSCGMLCCTCNAAKPLGLSSCADNGQRVCLATQTAGRSLPGSLHVLLLGGGPN